MKKLLFAKTVMALICIIWMLTVIISFTGCYTEKKATKQAVKAMNVYPLKVLPIFRGQYPCVDVNKADTVIVNTDTTIWVDCPDTIPASQYFTLHDTVVKKIQVPGKTIRVPVTLPVKTVTIVKEIEDLSRVTQMSLQLSAAEKERDEWKAKSKNKSSWIRWLALAIVGLLIPHIIRIVKLFT